LAAEAESSLKQTSKHKENTKNKKQTNKQAEETQFCLFVCFIAWKNILRVNKGSEHN